MTVRLIQTQAPDSSDDRAPDYGSRGPRVQILVWSAIISPIRLQTIVYKWARPSSHS